MGVYRRVLIDWDKHIVDEKWEVMITEEKNCYVVWVDYIIRPPREQHNFPSCGPKHVYRLKKDAIEKADRIVTEMREQLREHV